MPYLRAYARDIEGTDTPETPITWVASTEGYQMDGIDLKSGDWDLARYNDQYGPVLWAHDFWGERPPIGKGVAFVEDGKLMVRVTYDTDDPFAMLIRAKARKKMVAGSVSWDPRTTGEGEDTQTRNTLLEFSMVPVPVDPASLPVRQRSAMRDLAQRLLEATETPTDEDGWLETASQMVGLFQSVADDSERQAIYRRLEREYKRFDKTPPEFLTKFDLKPFAATELRGLFLEGEPEMFPELFEEPLELQQRQVDAISEAIALLQAALDGAEIESEPTEEASIMPDLANLLADASITITGDTNDDSNDQ